LGAVGKGKLFWFFGVGFVCRQKPNVLDRAVGFLLVSFMQQKFLCHSVVCFGLFTMNANDLQLPEGGDLEALHCQPSSNFDRSTKLDLTTEPPLLGRCCYSQ